MDSFCVSSRGRPAETMVSAGSLHPCSVMPGCDPVSSECLGTAALYVCKCICTGTKNDGRSYSTMAGAIALDHCLRAFHTPCPPAPVQGACSAARKPEVSLSLRRRRNRFILCLQWCCCCRRPLRLLPLLPSLLLCFPLARQISHILVVVRSSLRRRRNRFLLCLQCCCCNTIWFRMGLVMCS